MNINTYWELPPAQQEEQRKALAAQELQAKADEKHMLVLNGKLIQPEDYPCVCELASPDHCYEERANIEKKWLPQEKEAQQCFCPCHTWYEPF